MQKQPSLITRISVYQTDLPLHEGSYFWADGKSVDVFDSTLVEIETKDGLKGYGEVCPLGTAYLPAFAKGVRAGLDELAPQLLGLDAASVGVINQVMDTTLLGHPYIKSPIDIACWDILGHKTGMPVVTLLGGRFGDSVSLYRAISQASPEKMAQKVAGYRKEGYTKFQLKVGGDVDDDIERIRQVKSLLGQGEILIADANTGWLSHQAIRVANALAGLDVYMEQPCKTYQECLRVRAHTNLPMILDENMDSVQAILTGWKDRAMDAINLKISKVGGLTKAMQIRNLCVTLGLPMTLEDSWGGDFTTAAITHLAHSTPEALRFSSTDFNSYVTVSTSHNAPKRKNGVIQAPKEAGLGLQPNFDVLKKPVVVYQ